MIDAYPLRARTPASATLAEALEDPNLLCAESSDINKFVLTYRTEMGQARKAGGKKPGFIDIVLGSIERIYADILQQIRPWTPSAPRLRPQSSRDDVEAQPTRDNEVESSLMRRATDEVSEEAAASERPSTVVTPVANS